MPAFALEVIFL